MVLFFQVNTDLGLFPLFVEIGKKTGLGAQWNCLVFLDSVLGMDHLHQKPFVKIRVSRLIPGSRREGLRNLFHQVAPQSILGTPEFENYYCKDYVEADFSKPSQ